MLRSVLMFFGFLFITVMIIALQPGPRLRDVPVATPSRDVTRSEASPLVGAHNTAERSVPPIVEPIVDLQIEKEAPEQQPNALAAERLKTVLTSVPAEPEIQENLEAMPQVIEIAAAPQTSVSQPRNTSADGELRAMTWDALGGLSAVTGRVSAPGQTGSLLSSVVRRSMQNVSQDAQPYADREQGTTYVVKSGDTLATIAIALYGSATAKQRLIAENRDVLSSPDQLRVGQVLRVPTH